MPVIEEQNIILKAFSLEYLRGSRRKWTGRWHNEQMTWSSVTSRDTWSCFCDSLRGFSRWETCIVYWRREVPHIFLILYEYVTDFLKETCDLCLTPYWIISRHIYSVLFYLWPLLFSHTRFEKWNFKVMKLYFLQWNGTSTLT